MTCVNEPDDHAPHDPAETTLTRSDSPDRVTVVETPDVSDPLVLGVAWAKDGNLTNTEAAVYLYVADRALAVPPGVDAEVDRDQLPDQVCDRFGIPRDHARDVLAALVSKGALELHSATYQVVRGVPRRPRTSGEGVQR